MITVSLGGFSFARGEIPESIAFGASQKVNIHTLVGGARVIDAMGMVPQNPEWSGWFVGAGALARARQLKQMAEAGKPLPLRWGEFSYSVIIARFSAEFRAGTNLPYHIALEVVSDDASPAGNDVLPGLAQATAQDLATATGNASVIGDPGLIAAVASIGSAVAGSSLSAGAPPAASISAGLQQSIAAGQAVATALDATASAKLAALSPLSTPNAASPDPLPQFVAGLAAAAAAANTSFLLNATGQVLGRLSANLTAASGGGTVLATGSTDLYHLAAATYGDARAWTQIAQANALTDPAITGITRLNIPPASPVPAAGVLNG